MISSPMFYGWFLNRKDETKLKKLSFKILNDTLKLNKVHNVFCNETGVDLSMKIILYSNKG